MSNDRFFIDFGSDVGMVSFQATAPHKVSSGKSILSTFVVVKTVRLSKGDAEEFDLPTLIDAWRIITVKLDNQNEIFIDVEAMIASGGGRQDGDVNATFKLLRGNAREALGSMSATIQTIVEDTYKREKFNLNQLPLL